MNSPTGYYAHYTHTVDDALVTLSYPVIDVVNYEPRIITVDGGVTSVRDHLMFLFSQEETPELSTWAVEVTPAV